MWLTSPLVAQERNVLLDLGVQQNLSTPSGQFAASLEGFEPTYGGRVGIKYNFDIGLLLGREVFSNGWDIKASQSNSSFLVAVMSYNTLGWVLSSESFACFLEVGLEESALLLTTTARFDGKIKNRQYTPSNMRGLSILWLPSSYFPVGILVSGRYVLLKTEDQFNTGKALDLSGFQAGLGLGLYF